MKKTHKRRRRNKKKKVFTRKHYEDNNGMLTSVWGPSLWHYLHTMSFNYPIHPTAQQKKHYKEFILLLQHVMPCGHCRKNFKKNLKCLPLRNKDFKNRETFSKWIFKLHERVNKMLGKKSGLTYCKVRDRYENFRSRCSKKKKKTRKKREQGCTEPIYGQKSKCVIKIVPQKKKCKTFQMDKKCYKRR